jgi:hypothetical protein
LDEAVDLDLITRASLSPPARKPATWTDDVHTIDFDFLSIEEVQKKKQRRAPSIASLSTGEVRK